MRSQRADGGATAGGVHGIDRMLRNVETGRWPPTARPCLTCGPIRTSPIPPHATFEQMKDAAAAMLKGDPDRWGVLKEGFRTKVQEFLPGKGSQGSR